MRQTGVLREAGTSGHLWSDAEIRLKAQELHRRAFPDATQPPAAETDRSELIRAACSVAAALASRGEYQWLEELADLLAVTGDRTRLNEILGNVLGALAEDIYGGEMEVWWAFARAFAALDDRDGINRLLQEIELIVDNTGRANALRNMAAPLAEVGDAHMLDRFERIAYFLDPCIRISKRTCRPPSAQSGRGRTGGGVRQACRAVDSTTRGIARRRRAPDPADGGSRGSVSRSWPK
jgi:hypothetical protein